jgi:hypothetical protein
MSQHVVCDQCVKVVDPVEGYYTVVVTKVHTNEDGAIVVVEPAVSLDFHPAHLPNKLIRANPDAPVVDHRDTEA